MTVDVVVDILRQSIFLILVLCSVLILPGLLVGFVMSLLMAATQINEQSLSFFPKLIVTFLSIGWAGPWLLKKILEFFTTIMHHAASVGGGSLF